MDSDSARGVDRRRLLGWAGLAAVGAAAGAPLVGAGLGHAAPDPSGHDRIPPDTRPGGAYDRYVAELAADEHIAHPYMLQADGSRVDAVRNLDKGTLNPYIPGRNPGRAFIGYSSGDGFATAPDLVRFANALRDGTVLARPYADLFAGPKLPGHDPTSYDAYTMPVSIVGDQWVIGRGGATGGSSVNWSIYPDTGWVGVVLSNYDDIPLPEICLQEVKAITGVTLDPPDGG